MTADTSAVIAALSTWHEQHVVAAEAIADVRALPAHALLEAYSVLTRLPGGLAVDPTEAARVLAAAFDAAPLQVPARERRRMLDGFAGAGVAGGASYDGLVGLEARANEQMLITLDRRALETYRRLDVPARLLAG